MSRTTRALAITATTLILIAISAGSAAGQRTHVVQSGESLWSIASVNGLDPADVAAANGLSADAGLVAGSVIEIPSPVTQGTGECVWDCASAVHPHPTDEVASPGQVADIAARYGMSTDLVQAIADVESDFDNSAVSSADARGVMQIIPDTWEFVDEAVADGGLDPNSAAGNIEAGVLYLRHLYRISGGSRDHTIGSYYQGPNRDELLPETVDYINLVDSAQAELWSGG